MTATRTLSSYCRHNEHVLCRTASAKCECSCHPIEKPARVVRSIGARRSRPSPRPRAVVPVESIRPTVSKDRAECCNALRDDLGRLPIGYCGPDCVRRSR